MSHHDIEIVQQGQEVLPEPPFPLMKVGDTVQYHFKGQGHLTIVFPELSPYRTDQEEHTKVDEAQTLTIMREGNFRSGCRVTLASGETIGWDPDDPTAHPTSGGDHRVGH